MLFGVRPLLGMLHRRLMAKQQVDNRYYMCLVMLLLIAAAFTTQGLGIHCFFGAFVMGLITPKERGFAEGIADRMELVTGEA
jgi:Kef-type K+ transport system membrane component KefB